MAGGNEPSLQGLRLLLTRPKVDAEWAHFLSAQGVLTEHVATLALEPLPIESEQQQALQGSGIGIFVSRNSVEHFATMVERQCLHVPKTIQWLAVGEATARAATLAGFNTCSHKAYNSETLLECEPLSVVEGQKICIIRGEGGREHLANILRVRGAEVNYCQLYVRTCAFDSQARLASCLQQWRPHLISTASVDTLRFTVQLAEMSGLKNQILNTAFLLPGDRVAAAAEQMGLTTLVIARSMQISDVLYTLKHWWHKAKAEKPKDEQ